MQAETRGGIVAHILKTTEELNQLQHLETILDRLLDRACEFSGADAGSIFLVEDDRLRISSIVNETLFPGKGAESTLYKNLSVPIDTSSLAGYVAHSGWLLVIDDAYRLDNTAPYRFNRSYDEASKYRTRSVLGVPLKSYRNRMVGVMQLINAKGEEGRVVPFSETSRTYVPLFAANATVAIERGLMTREMVLRMMRMAEMRDPGETGAHVQRVGAYAALIYSALPGERLRPKQEIKRTSDLLRVAAMLHDVGKVGIPDNILKKPARLTREEFETMKWHTVFGARLFDNANSELDRLCRDIALYHHQKWEGGGYPGKIFDLSGAAFDDDCRMANVKLAGDDIPLAARIVALADVYDALMSKRCYKDAWPESKVLDIIRQQRGTHFDPDVVDAFFDVYPSIRSVWRQYPDQHRAVSQGARDTLVDTGDVARADKVGVPPTIVAASSFAS